MPRLALLGGTPVRREKWPGWPIRTNEIKNLRKALDSLTWSYDGPFQVEFEKKFSRFCGTGFCLTCSNGTTALMLALEASGIKPGDEVIIPGLTWQGTATAVLDVNATPVFVDVDPDTYCIDPKRVNENITERTKAIIVVHMYSCMADMDSISKIARKYDLPIIEDCAHQVGSEWKSKRSGSLGDAGCFSMQRSKLITCGEGGALTTNSVEIYQRVYSLRSDGRNTGGTGVMGDPENIGEIFGSNYRITEFQSAVLVAQLDRILEHLNCQNASASFLDHRLRRIDGIRPLEPYEGNNFRSFYFYVFRYDSEAFGGMPLTLFRKALEAELGVRVYQSYNALNRDPFYQPLTRRRYLWDASRRVALDTKKFELPIAERARDESVLLHHPILLGEIEDMEDIVAAVEKIQSSCHELVDNVSREPNVLRS